MATDFKDCYPMKNEKKQSCLKNYRRFQNLYGKPKIMLTDNADALKVEGVKHITTPSNHPEWNTKLERMHKELGKQCRIHGVLPDEAIQVL